MKSKKIKTHIFNGTVATEEMFKQNCQIPSDIIHIATHGFCLKQTSDFKVGENYVQQNNPRTMKEASMVYSGLAFAGANNIWKGKSEGRNTNDGILSAYEISQMDLSNTKLAVLSACETAQGWIFDFDGVFGLQRAFKQAGAGAILMSLWKVNDAATSLFMQHFYKSLMQTGDRHKALNFARNEVKKDFPDPYYWAAWVLLD